MSVDDEHSESVLSQLDWKSQVILEAIYTLGGTATTSEIKEHTGIKTNDDIYYRYRRAAVALEPHGLIEVNESPNSPQRNPPFEVTLTENGERLAERLSERSKRSTSLSFEERLEKIEATLSTLEERLADQPPEPRTAPESDPTGSEARLRAVEQRLDRFEEDTFGGWSDENQQQYQVMLAGERAVRDFLLDEYGEPFKQYVDERLEEYLDTHENNDDSQR